jgi:hypothetical protein
VSGRRYALNDAGEVELDPMFGQFAELPDIFTRWRTA